MGVRCNLVTGQEVRRVKGARHTACTIEMADLTNRVDVSQSSLATKGTSCVYFTIHWTKSLLSLLGLLPAQHATAALKCSQKAVPTPAIGQLTSDAAY